MELEARASEVGGCPRAIAAKWLRLSSEPTPSWLLERFQRGVAAEPAILAQLAAAVEGRLLPDWAQREVSFHLGGVRIVGHLDGLVELPDGQRAVAEAKLASERRYQRVCQDPTTLPRRYLAQVASYAVAAGVDRAVFCYARASDDPEPLLVWVSSQGIGEGLLAAATCLVEAQKAYDAGDITVADPDPGEFGCTACEWRVHCGMGEPDVAEGTPEDVRWAARWARAQATIKAAEAEVETCRAYFVGRLDELGADRVVTPAGRVTRSSTRLVNWAAVKEQCGGELPMRESITMRFTPVRLKDKESKGQGE